MPLTKDIVGKKLPPFSFLVERGKLREFCLAIGETNPIYWDKAKAIEAGFSDTPIPLTFQTCFLFWGYTNFWKDIEEMGIDTKRLLHMKEEYTYHHPIYPNNTILCQLEVSDVKTGKVEMATFKGSFTNENGQLCLESEMGIILRPQ